MECSYREKWRTRNIRQKCNPKGEYKKSRERGGGCERSREQDDEEADEEEEFAFTAEKIVTATNAAALRTRGRIIMR